MIDFSSKKEKEIHNKLVSSVKAMLVLNEQFSKHKNEQEKDSILKRVKTTDYQIDRMVYELYELTEKEIKIIENQ